MGRKIFVSYKYHDNAVYDLESKSNSNVRDYVDEFETMLEESDNIYKGESDGEDLSQLSDETIWEKLKNRIYDSSLTIVFISPNMKEVGICEKEQWIPWEISYSLKEISRKNKNGDPITSKTNAMIAIVLPDINNDYSYYLESRNCCTINCATHHTNRLFKILRENKFNFINASKKECEKDSIIWYGEYSYIKAIKWSNFIADIDQHINDAYARQNNISDYKIYKDVD